MKSASAASSPLRSGHCTRRIALFFKSCPLISADILLNFGGETAGSDSVCHPQAEAGQQRTAKSGCASFATQAVELTLFERSPILERSNSWVSSHLSGLSAPHGMEQIPPRPAKIHSKTSGCPRKGLLHV